MQLHKNQAACLRRFLITQFCAWVLTFVASFAHSQGTIPGSQLQTRDVNQDVQLMFYLAELADPTVLGGGSGWYSHDGYTFQYFASSGIFAGAKGDEVFLAGAAYGDNPVLVGSVSSVLATLKAQTHADISADAQLLFYLAQTANPSVFGGNGSWHLSGGYTYQYFANSGVYAGVKDGEVFLMGGAYGNAPVSFGSISSVLALLKEETGAHVLNLSLENMVFESSGQVDAIPAQSFTVTSKIPTAWSLQASADWISLSSTSGTTESANAINVSINADAAGLGPGKHTASVLVRNLADNNLSVHLPVVLYVTKPGIKVTQSIADRLGFEVAYVVHDEKHKRFYFSDRTAKRVYQVDAASGLTTQYFQFDKTPERMTISPDGNKLYVSLLDRAHSPYVWTDEQSGAIGIINLTTQRSLGYFTIDIDPYDLVINSSGKLVVSSGSGQWTAIKAYDVVAGVEVGEGYIRESSRLSLHPDQQWVFSADTDVVPSDIRKFDISGKGIIDLGDSPYHGEHRMEGNVWAAPNGRHIYTRGGDIFLASSMTYVATLLENEEIEDLVFDIDSNSVVVLTESSKVMRFGLADFKLVSNIAGSFADPRFVEIVDGEIVIVDFVMGQYRLMRF